MLCNFRLNSPVPDFRSIPEAVRLAAIFPKDEPSTKLLSEWTAIAAGGPIPQELAVPQAPESPNERARWATCNLFALERLKPGEWNDANRDILAKITKVLENDLIHATSWRIRCRELQAVEKAAHRTTNEDH